jgi:teichuronic acid biosynthesis glycosyltransferase TuaG
MNQKKQNQELLSVTIVMPSFNSIKFIQDSVKSIQKQSYSNWHLIIVDDYSTDGTRELLSKLSNDKRITIILLESNFGAAHARQIAIDYSNGDLVAFCDSDDLWHPDKLLEQVNFMSINNYSFTYTLYSPFKEIHKKYRPDRYSLSKNYISILIHSLGNSTVMLDGNLCRSTKIPNIRKRNDYLYFLKVIKKAKRAYLLNKPLTYYRLNKDGLSNNKINLIKYHWIIYRKYENFNTFISILLIILISMRKILSILRTRY